MNPPDANYWLSLAAQWIQSRSQTQMTFPAEFYGSQIMQIPEAPLISGNYPEPPKITRDDLATNDNLGEADMDLDEDMVKDEEPAQTWTNNWPQPANLQQELPAKPSPIVQHKAPAPHHQSRFSNEKSASRFNHRISEPPVAVPQQPIVAQPIEPVDMVLDSDEDEGDGSPMMTEAQKRKKLPPWIREGLERIEREKKQESLRIQKEAEFQKDEENRKKMMEEALKELEREKTIRSKYESPSEDEDEPETLDGTPEVERPMQNTNDEDAYEKMMLLVRKTLTEILLEVTDEKIHEISSETLSKYRKKASSVTSKRTVTNSLGLGIYADSSDADSEVEEGAKADDQSDWEPDYVIKERIRIKSLAYEQRSKEIKEKLAKISEAEQKRFSKKDEVDQSRSKYDSDNEKPVKKARKNDGEEKYDQIYSVSSSLASSSRQRDKKKTRFNDPKERASGLLLTHLGTIDKNNADNGSSSILPTLQPPAQESVGDKKAKRDASTSSTSSSSSSGHHKKHKKHKKSSKRSKKSKKRERSRSRDEKDRRKAHKSDRRSMESKSSVRSSESRRHRSRSRSRSHDRDRRHRSRRY